MNSTTSVPRIFLISYEFTFSTFSGNGILARSLVLSLLQQGCDVTVWCCRPPPQDASNDDNGKDHPIEVPEVSPEEFDRLRIIYTTISSNAKWHRLDDESAWAEFVWESLSSSSSDRAKKAVKQASAVLVVDWTGHHAWKSIPTFFGSDNCDVPKLVFMNFRVFASGVKDAQKQRWFNEKEQDAVQQADLVVALSQKDKASLLAMMTQQDATKIHILVPPLRKDVENLAKRHMESADQSTSIFWDHMPQEAVKALTLPDGTITPRKCFVTSVVRLSPEKNTRRFVRFLSDPKTKAFLKQQNWIALLAGSASDPEYAQLVKKELTALYGDDNKECVILNSFLSPESLAAVFSCAVVNFHAARYDAFGLTIIEAAAVGVPSVIQAGDSVGASILVGNGGSIEVDFQDSGHQDHDHDQLPQEAVGQVLEKLEDKRELESIGREARKRALAWDEAAYGKALLQLIAELPSKSK